MNEMPTKTATHDEIMLQLWDTAANGQSREVRMAAKAYLVDKILDTISTLTDRVGSNC